MRRGRLLPAVAGAVALAACGGGGGGSHDVSGTVVTSIGTLDVQTIRGPAKAGDPCKSISFRDTPNAEVLVKEAKGAIIGKTNLGAQGSFRTTQPAGCVYTFSLSLPDSDFYSFSIAGRSGPSYSRTELKSAGYRVELAP